MQNKKAKIESSFTFSKEARLKSKTHKIFCGKGSLDRADVFSKNNNRLPIFAKDVTVEGQKEYHVCSYEKMFTMLKNETISHYFFEVVLYDIPSYFFVDVDVEPKLNNNITFEELQKIENEFLEYAKEFYIKCEIISDLSELEIIILDSSISTDEKVKFSRHYIFICEKFFKNMYHCGSFARALQNFIILQKEGISNPKNSKFWFNKKSKSKNPEEKSGFFCDLKIYTFRRVYRTWNSDKKHDTIKRPFRIYPENIIDEKSYYKYFVQANSDLEKEIIIFKEYNGEEPWSTSDVTLGRFDMIKDPSHLRKEQKRLSFGKVKPEIFKIQEDTESINFYRTTFPFEKFWDLFGEPNREFGISTERNEFFNRNLFFPNIQNFKNFILSSKNICSIHIGPISPMDEKSHKRIPLVKEFVLDIDIKDYTDEKIGNLKNCCENDTVCKKCWIIMKLSILIIDIIYSKSLGIKDYSFIFSGRGGFHCWIFEKKYRQMTKNVVKDLVKMLSFENCGKTHPIFSLLLKNQEIIKTLNEMRKCDFLIDMKSLSDIELLNIYRPRIDTKPLFELNHLIKSPYTLHSKTKRMCVELDKESGFVFPSSFLVK